MMNKDTTPEKRRPSRLGPKPLRRNSVVSDGTASVLRRLPGLGIKPWHLCQQEGAKDGIDQLRRCPSDGQSAQLESAPMASIGIECVHDNRAIDVI